MIRKVYKVTKSCNKKYDRGSPGQHSSSSVAPPHLDTTAPHLPPLLLMLTASALISNNFRFVFLFKRIIGSSSSGVDCAVFAQRSLNCWWVFSLK